MNLFYIILMIILLPLTLSIPIVFDYFKYFKINFRYVFISLLFLLSLNVVSAIGTEKLYSYWTLDNTSEFFGNFTLTNSGATSQSSGQCYKGTCFLFDGSNDQMFTSSNIGITGSSARTMGGWVRYTGSTEHNAGFFGYGLGNAGQQFQMMESVNSNSGWMFWGFSADVNVNTGFNINDGNWHHIVSVYESGASTTRVYLDGSEVTTTTSGGNFPLNTPASVFKFGVNSIGVYFDGYIDETAIFNTNLNDSEILDWYNNGIVTEVTPVLEFTNITINGETIQPNQTIITNDLTFNVTVATTSTNDNVNQTYFLYFNNSLNDSQQYATNQLNASFMLNLTQEGFYNISFFAENNETNATAGNFTIHLDFTPPTIDLNISAEYNYYLINWSEVLNVSDAQRDFQSEIVSCVLDFSVGASTNCTDQAYTFAQNGNISFNITAEDEGGNIAILTNNTVLVNPYFYVYFNNNTDFLTNFQVNSINYTNYFNGTIYEYGLGTHSFLFQKAGYNDTNFSLTFTNTSDINTTIFVPNVYLTINIRDISNGSLAPPSNYTLIIIDNVTNIPVTYELINNNSLTIANTYFSNTGLKISVIFNETITNKGELVTARQNVSIDIYLTFETIEQRVIEALTGGLIAITNSEVFLYTYIEGTGFVLETTKVTNVLGQVVFNIVPLTKVYNICNVYNGVEKCLNQITFENANTDPFQIVHDVELNPIEKIFLNFISWSYNENKTNTSTQMTMTFNDAQSLVSSFCYNVTRYTNNTPTFTNEYCNNNPSGQIVQTFGLDQTQKIDFVFFYVLDGERNVLGTYTSWGINSDLIQLNQVSLFDVVFLLIYFVAIGFLLELNNFTYYNVGILGLLLGIFSIQAYFNENYVEAGIWGFMLIKTLVYYFVRVES